MSRRPNVLFITTDQQRYDAVGYMRHPDVRTPHIDRLAAEGVVFERVYVTDPVCMPSRATLMTGQFPDAHGVRRNGIEVPDQPWGLARTLRSHGYRTGMFGKTHFSPLRRDYWPEFGFHDWRTGEDYYGFETRAITHDLKDYVSDLATYERSREEQRRGEYIYALDDYVDWIAERHPELYALAVREGLPPDQTADVREVWTSELPVERHQSTWIADRALEYIEQRRDEPFFAWCSFVDPHHPFNAPAAYRDRYDASALAAPVWREGELEERSRYHRDRHEREFAPWREHWREYRAHYYAMISLVDEQVGRLVGALGDLGLLEDTVVIFSSDHGEMLGDHGLARKGLFHYEPLIRIPLAVYGPGRCVAGVRQPGIVQSVDIPATILGVAGIQLPYQYQGVPLVPWLRGERDDPPRVSALITNGGEGPHYSPWPELRTLVTERWKLSHYTGEDYAELDDLQDDPLELNPPDIRGREDLVRDLMGQLVDAGSAASVWRPHIGRW
jgi:arylsulfatase A-like enzyme